jgi:hypothetical protein
MGAFWTHYKNTTETPTADHCKETCSVISPNLGTFDGVRVPARLLEQAWHCGPRCPQGRFCVGRSRIWRDEGWEPLGVNDAVAIGRARSRFGSGILACGAHLHLQSKQKIPICLYFLGWKSHFAPRPCQYNDLWSQRSCKVSCQRRPRRSICSRTGRKSTRETPSPIRKRFEFHRSS